MFDKRINALDFLPFFLIFALYLSTLSNNFSLTHDSIGFLLQLRAGDAGFHANHLLYLPFLPAIVKAASLAGIASSVHLIVEAAGAMAGTLTLLAGYLILRQRFGVLRWNALAAMAAAGLTYGTWYYSVAIEIYIYPLLFLAWAFFVLTSPALTWRGIVVAAALQSAAILFHQTAVLFSFVPLIVLLTPRSNDWGVARPIGRLLLYGAIGSVIVCGSYWSAADSLGHADSTDEFVQWFLGYGASTQYWSPASIKALLLAATGLGRALIGGHFLFGIPALSGPLQALFSGKSLEDEIFLVRGVPDWADYTLLALAVTAGALLLFLAARAVSVLARDRSAMPRRGLVLLIAWLVPYTLFFIAWDASNVDFWVLQGFVAMLLVAGVLQTRDERDRQPARYFAALAVVLFILNGAGSVFLANNPDNDFYRAYLRPVQDHVTDNDFLLIGDSWPTANHLRLHTNAKFEAVSGAYRDRSPGALAAMLNQRLSSGQRVFLAQDLFEIASSTRNFYGARYTDYLAALRARFCGTTDVPAGPGIKLKALNCVR